MQPKTMIAAPRFAGILTENCSFQQAVTEDEDISGFRFLDDNLAASEGQTLSFAHCQFERCSFSGLTGGRISFADCRLDRCEMSNLQLEFASFQRVEFRSCRMTGCELTHAAVMNVRFESCMMDYFSAAETKLNRVLFHECRARESLWSEVRMIQTAFERTDLSAAQWMHTPLKGVDMSSCIIPGWRIALGDLQGVKVTICQVADFSGLLGVEIVDGPVD